MFISVIADEVLFLKAEGSLGFIGFLEDPAVNKLKCQMLFLTWKRQDFQIPNGHTTRDFQIPNGHTRDFQIPNGHTRDFQIPNGHTRDFQWSHKRGLKPNF